MLKILQARLKQYVNHELPDVQAGFRKGTGTRDLIANIHWIIEKAREFQKNIYFWFVDYTKAFDCVDHNKLWKILKETGIPDHLTCLLRNLYAGLEATVKTGHGTTVQFCSVTQSCPILCCSMNCNTPGLPVHHQLPEFTQTHVHWVSDTSQPSHPLLSPSPPAPNPYHASEYFPVSQLFA